MSRSIGLFAAVLLVASVGCTESQLIRPGVTDVRFQNPPTAVDILLVIDNSCSMEDEQAKLGSGFEEFVEYFEVADVDYHIGIITTDTTDPTQSGRLVDSGGRRIITNQTDDAGQLFEDLVDVGIAGDGTERGLDAAWAALTEPIVDNENSGFLREDALLSVIFVSDEEDASTGPTTDFINAFRGLKGQRRRDAFNASSLVGLDRDTASPADCQSGIGGQNNTAVAGWRYWDVATQTGGVARSICSESFTEIITEMGLASSRLQDRFFLSRVPQRNEATTIVVKMINPGVDELGADGVEVPTEGLDEGLFAWVYENSEVPEGDDDDDAGEEELVTTGQWIRFTDPSRLPPLDTTLEIRYAI